MEHLILRIFDNQHLEGLTFSTTKEEDNAIKKGNNDLYCIIKKEDNKIYNYRYLVIEPSKANLGELKALVKLMEEKMGD